MEKWRKRKDCGGEQILFMWSSISASGAFTLYNYSALDQKGLTLLYDASATWSLLTLNAIHKHRNLATLDKLCTNAAYPWTYVGYDGASYNIQTTQLVWKSYISLRTGLLWSLHASHRMTSLTLHLVQHSMVHNIERAEFGPKETEWEKSVEVSFSGRNHDRSGTKKKKEEENVSTRRRCGVEKNTGPASCQCVRTWALQIDLCLDLVCSTVVFGSLKHIKGGEQIQWLLILAWVS